jgi:hypothetical protein
MFVPLRSLVSAIIPRRLRAAFLSGWQFGDQALSG